MKSLVFWNIVSSRLDVSVKFSASIFLNDIVINIMTYAPPLPLPHPGHRNANNFLPGHTT